MANKDKNIQQEVAIIPFQNLVLYPSASIPLYIFDPIYIKLIEDCMENDRPVALALSDPAIGPGANKNSLFPRKVCGIGEIILLQEYPDRSKYVLIQGTGKVKLGPALQEVPYLICEAEKLSDTRVSAETILHNEQSVERLKEILDGWLSQNIKDSAQRHILLEKIQSASNIVDYLATFLVTDREVKQILLETHDLVERVEILNLLFNGKNPYKENSYYSKILISYEYLEKTGTFCEN